MRVSVLLLALFGALALVNGGLLTTRNFAPEGWSKLSAASPHSEVEFTIGLYNRNLDVLEQKFWEVSDPQHENYQNFMSIEEINALVAPPKADHDKVVDWLIKHGVQERKIKSFTDAMDVKTTVAVASRLFQTSFHVFEHITEKTTTISAWGEMSLPDNIHKYVKIVTGISTFPIPHLRVHRSRSNTGADRKLLQGDTQGIIAQSLTTLYSLPVEHFGTAMKTSQGVIEFQGQNYAPTDLSSYGQQVNLNIETLANNHIIGPNDPTNPQIEPTLDIEMIATVNREADNWFWLETGNGWLYQFGNHFFNTATVPQISSISYGWWEGDQCSISSNCGALGINSTQYTEAVNVLFQKIALRGISLLASSGDSGANGRTDPDCTIPQLRPAFPASSPYITAVGATQLNHPVYNLPGVASIPICNGNGYTCASNGDEVAVSYAISQFASGGGFSNIAAQPSYQKAAVAAYWNSGVPMPPASYFNKTGRGFPDIAALGHNGLIYTGGAAQAVGGTSMSAPISAAVFSLLNQAQMKNTGKPLGFLNPLIYQAFAADPTNFNDITVGDNICTEDGCSSGCTGFTAAKGWDPVTGVGSPNYAKLLAYINAQTELRQKKKATLAQA